MKKELIPFLIAMASVLCSCESNDEVVPDNGELVELTLNEIDKNHEILTKAYEGLTQTAHKEAILTCRKSGGDQAQFMFEMYEKANKAFENALTTTLGQKAADYFLKIDGVEGESTEKKIELLLVENPTQAYADVTLKRLKLMSAQTDRWSIMKKLELNGKSHTLPTEQISLNFQKITNAVNAANILLDLGLSEQERGEAMKDVFDVAGIPPVAIALLLPAVQHVRESANATKAEEMYLKWIDTEVIPTVQGALDRDIIRRKAFFEYLGALDLIVGQNFNNENQLSASIAIMKARYDWKLLTLWAAFWNMELEGE